MATGDWSCLVYHASDLWWYVTARDSGVPVTERNSVNSGPFGSDKAAQAWAEAHLGRWGRGHRANGGHTARYARPRRPTEFLSVQPRHS